MAVSRSWRHGQRAEGPYPARLDDIAALNQVFSEAFSERYRRDGMAGVRVPYLNPSIWRYAIEDADGGALLWRDEQEAIVAFNIVHRSGTEGWMGPLAVRPDHQSFGLGKDVVRAGIDWLLGVRARVVGLETMPRTMDNIGFYSGLGFVPGRLTITLTVDAAPGDHPPMLLGKLKGVDRDEAILACRELANRLAPGFDYTREIELTHSLGLGDTVLLRSRGQLTGFALCHFVPLVEGRAREELRVLKLALASERDIESMLRTLADVARRSGTRRVAFRAQTEYVVAFQRLIAAGGRVRWSDLRMTLAGHPELRAEGGGLLWSNWEI